MKKLYFFLMAMLVAVTANAATVYFQNSDNWATVAFYCWGGAGASAKWPGDVVTTTVEKDGVTYYKVTTECPSGIFNNNDQGKQTSDLQIVDNMIYNANGSTGTSFEGGTIEITKSFTLAGNFNSYNGNDATYAFTDKGNDIFTLHLESLTATNDFAVVENGAVWYKYAAGPMASGQTYTLSTSGMDNCKLTGAATNIDFEFNASNNTLKVTYTTEGGEIDPPTPGTDFTGWYFNVQGEFNNWQASGVAFNADGTAAANNLAIGTGLFNIKIWNGKEDLFYGVSGEVSVGEVQLIENGGEMTIAGATEGGLYNVAFDYNTGIMTLTKVGAIDYTTWYLNVVGDFNEWGTAADFQGVQFNEEGVAIAENLAIGTDSFKVKLYDGAGDIWRSNGEALAFNTEYVLTGNSDTNMTIEGATADTCVSLKYDAKTNTLTLTNTTAVEEVEVAEGEAVYFNLQGVQVANPENGIYVKVVDGKATKVVVK